MNLPSSKRCVFSTANDAYVPKAIVSLLSFNKHNADFDMFLLCGELSDENRRLCAACRVTPIELNRRNVFYQEWDYPRECYYHFEAPTLFLSRGYQYSVYIDGDTYCNGPFRWDESDCFRLAGSSYDTVRDFLVAVGDYEAICNRFAVTDACGFDRARIQAGVLLYDNRALDESDYFGKACELYDRSIKVGLPRKGDDSLLALLLALHPEILSTTLSHYHNFIDFRARASSSNGSDTCAIQHCVIYHFVKRKPWSAADNHPSYAHRYFAGKWLEVMINNFPQEEIKRCFPDHYKSSIVDANEVPFYWYSAPPANFGDWVTPYLVKAVCARQLEHAVDPIETGKPVILSIGSIMRLCGPNTVVWGSGIRDRYQEIQPGRMVRSVRGPITQARVWEVGGECPPIYGDPALLLPRVFDPGVRSKKYKLGIVPHISQYAKVRKLYAGEPDVTVIDLRTKDVEGVITEIVECEAIASSSLHGIVVSNAYGVPVRWIQFDTNICGDNTKFHDHFASIGRPDEDFIDAIAYRALPVRQILDQIEPYEIDIDLDRLWDAGVFHNGEVSKYIRYVLS